MEGGDEAKKAVEERVYTTVRTHILQCTPCPPRPERAWKEETRAALLPAHRRRQIRMRMRQQRGGTARATDYPLVRCRLFSTSSNRILPVDLKRLERCDVNEPFCAFPEYLAPLGNGAQL